MDSVVFSEQVGRGLAGCEGCTRLRGTVFFGVDRFFHSLHNPALKSLELRAEMFPAWFLDSLGLGLTASIHAKLEEDSPEIKACRGSRSNAKGEGKSRKRQRQLESIELDTMQISGRVQGGSLP
jgi:hypothetical protein